MDRREYDIMVCKLTHEGPVERIQYKAGSEVSVNAPAPESEKSKVEKGQDEAVQEMPVMYVKDHCPKCKGAEQRFKIAKVQYSEVNCSQNMDLARELNIEQTPTIIDPDGTRYVGDNAAVDWMKAHQVS